MTERSRFWGGTVTGDATVAPYDAETEFSQVLMSIAGAEDVPTNRSCVFRDALNELNVTGAGSPLSVNTGRALVYGTWYENDASVSVAVPTPGAATRIDRIVLRKDWALQTVRITRIAGAEGGGAPALTQTAGVTWDMPLFQASITTGGVITLTDERLIIPRSHGCRAYHSADVIIATATSTTLALDSERYDTDRFHDLVVNNSRITIPAGLGGKYLLTATVAWFGNATGWRIVSFQINGGGNFPARVSIAPGSAATALYMNLTTIYDLAAGDYVEVQVYQDSGVGLTLFGNVSAPNYSPEFSIHRLGA